MDKDTDRAMAGPAKSDEEAFFEALNGIEIERIFGKVDGKEDEFFDAIAARSDHLAKGTDPLGGRYPVQWSPDGTHTKPDIGTPSVTEGKLRTSIGSMSGYLIDSNGSTTAQFNLERQQVYKKIAELGARPGAEYTHLGNDIRAIIEEISRYTPESGPPIIDKDKGMTHFHRHGTAYITTRLAA